MNLYCRTRRVGGFEEARRGPVNRPLPPSWPGLPPAHARANTPRGFLQNGWASVYSAKGQYHVHCSWYSVQRSKQSLGGGGAHPTVEALEHWYRELGHVGPPEHSREPRNRGFAIGFLPGPVEQVPK